MEFATYTQWTLVAVAANPQSVTRAFVATTASFEKAEPETSTLRKVRGVSGSSCHMMSR